MEGVDGKGGKEGREEEKVGRDSRTNVVEKKEPGETASDQQSWKTITRQACLASTRTDLRKCLGGFMCVSSTSLPFPSLHLSIPNP